VDISDDKQILQVLTTHAGASDERKWTDIEEIDDHGNKKTTHKQKVVWSGIKFKDCIKDLFTTKEELISKGSKACKGISRTSIRIGEDTLQNTLTSLAPLAQSDERKNDLCSKKIENEDF